MKLTGITQTEVNYQKNRAEKIAETATLRKYLADTDWYVIREKEISKEVPGNILTERENARNMISVLEELL